MSLPLTKANHFDCFVQSDSECQTLQPGIWYYKIVEADHIYFVISRERAGVQFDLMYDTIFECCRKHVFRKTPPTLPNQIHQ
ncbi:hypothetical protein MLD38_025514 [Melastoma candidum]|uniref:Uncharacterized protein n=1 Tax=Melastoma candidum TaxID=119954 RepID=A0ACB9NZ35_9MYRT|nr:hypothetical protein MLD38_025514 [Melastoma candidum]